MQEMISFGANGSEEPEPLAVDLDNRLVAGDLLETPTAPRLEIGLLDPVVNGRG